MNATPDRVLTLVVAAYDVEAYLPACLQSVLVADRALRQTLEVIVVNDGSHDGTLGVARDFARRHPDVFRVIDKPNGHYGSCVNAALPAARGVFVKLLDADDTFDTVDFATYLERLKTVPETVDLVLSDYVQTDVCGAVTRRVAYPLAADATFGSDALAPCSRDMAMHAVAYRTSLLRHIGYRQTEGVAYSDREWLFEPVARMREGLYLPLAVYRYRLGRDGQSMAKKVLYRQRDQLLTVFESLCARYRALRAEGLDGAYLQTQFAEAAFFVISIYLWQGTLNERKRIVARVRAWQAEFPPIRAKIEGAALFSQTPFRFPYLVAVMRYPQMRGVFLNFVRIWRTFEALCRRFRGEDRHD